MRTLIKKDKLNRNAAWRWLISYFAHPVNVQEKQYYRYDGRERTQLLDAFTLLVRNWSGELTAYMLFPTNTAWKFPAPACKQCPKKNYKGFCEAVPKNQGKLWWSFS